MKIFSPFNDLAATLLPDGILARLQAPLHLQGQETHQGHRRVTQLQDEGFPHRTQSCVSPALLPLPLLYDFWLACLVAYPRTLSADPNFLIQLNNCL